MNVELFNEMVNNSTEKVENLNRSKLSEASPFEEGKSFREVMKSLSEKLEIAKENERKEGFSEKISEVIKKLNEILSKNSGRVSKELKKSGDFVLSSAKKAKNGIEGFSELSEDFSDQRNKKINGLVNESNTAAILNGVGTEGDSKNAKIVKNIKKSPESPMKNSNNKGNAILINEGKQLKKDSSFQEGDKNGIYVNGDDKEMFKEENRRIYRESKVFRLSDVKQDNLPEIPKKTMKRVLKSLEKLVENKILYNEERKAPKAATNLKAEGNLQGNFSIFKDKDKSEETMEKPQEHTLKSSSDSYQFHRGVIAQNIKFSNVKKNAKVLNKNLKGSSVENLDKSVDTESVSDRNYIYANLIVNDNGQVNRVVEDFQVSHSELGKIISRIVELSKELDIYVNYSKEITKSLRVDKDKNYNTKSRVQVKVIKQKKITLERMEISVDKKTKKLFSTEVRVVHELKDKVGSNMDKIKNIQASKKFQDIYSEKIQMKEDISRNNHHSEIKSDNDDLNNYDKNNARLFNYNEKPSLMIGKKEFTIEDITNRVVETIVRRSSESNFRETAVLRLNPPDLGRVEITIIKDGDNVEIRFKVFNKDAQDTLEKSIHLLSSRLNSQGFNIEKIEVMQENRDSYNDEYKDENNSYEGDSRGNNEKRQKERKEEGENDDGE